MSQINVRINEKCNLRCRHCFEGQMVTLNGIMSLSQFKNDRSLCNLKCALE